MKLKDSIIIILVVVIVIVVGVFVGWKISENKYINNSSIDNSVNQENNNDKVDNNNADNQNDQQKENENHNDNGPIEFTLKDAEKLINNYKRYHYLENGDYYFYKINDDSDKNVFVVENLEPIKMTCEEVFGRQGCDEAEFDYYCAEEGCKYYEKLDTYSYDEILSKKKYFFGENSTSNKSKFDFLPC